jgi:hypothetical protein
MANVPLRTLSGLTAGSIVIASLLVAPVAQANVAREPSHVVGAKQGRVAAFTLTMEDQLLAYLRYLPVSFYVKIKVKASVPTTTSTTTMPVTTTTVAGSTTTTLPSSTTTTVAGSTTTTSTTSTTTTTVASSTRTITTTRLKKPTAPQPGRYVWRFQSLPPVLRSLWHVGTNNVILEGALMRFQSVNNLPTTGQMDTRTWESLNVAALQHRYDPMTYNFVLVSKALPQKLKLYLNGRLKYSSFVNTGISVAPTQSGTFPVYLHYVTTTMSGTNPNGTSYHDPGIPWVSYFNGGDALHGFLRGSYGWPQSLGCVEMPFANAGVVWPHTPIGTLVSVQ